MDVFEKIAAQQKGKENTGPWMVGEQLKDICRKDSHCAQLVCDDLDKQSMSLEKAEQKIESWADSNRKGKSCVCVPPNVAEKIIREFYGLPDAAPEESTPIHIPAAAPVPEPAGILSLDDFL